MVRRKTAKPAKPEVGAIALFSDFGTHGHTGRVVKVTKRYVHVKPIDPDGHKRIPIEAIRGWWPKGARKRTADRLVRPTAVPA